MHFLHPLLEIGGDLQLNQSSSQVNSFAQMQLCWLISLASSFTHKNVSAPHSFRLLGIHEHGGQGNTEEKLSLDTVISQPHLFSRCQMLVLHSYML